MMAWISSRLTKSGPRWDVSYRDVSGRRRKETFADREEASQRKRDVETEVYRSARTWRAPDRSTLSELGDRWLALRAQEDLSADSLNIDRAFVENHLRPVLGNRMGITLTPADVDVWEHELAAGTHSKPLARNTIQGYRSRLGMIMDLLVASRDLPTNPVRAVPRRRRALGRPPKKVPELSIRGLEALLDAAAVWERPRAAPGQTRREILWQAIQGTRPTEMLKLRWCDCDLERADPRVWIHGTKTEASDNWIPLFRPGVVILAGQRDGTAYGDQHDLIFPALTGRAMTASNWRRTHFNPLRDRAGLDPSFTPRTLRHLATSVARGTNADADVIRRIGRWTSLDMVSHYSHGIEEWLADASHLEHPLAGLATPPGAP
jgi:integrase